MTSARTDTAALLLACIAFAEFGDRIDSIHDDELNQAYARLCVLLVAIRDRLQ